ncbi:MAG TPA: sensor histidine kinase [Rhodocyclaceae bacterium]|nr:sensor histidine kinase [Rhodocyclaceae bacterium]
MADESILEPDDKGMLARQLAASEQKLRALANRLLTIKDEEQFRISREIHDSLGQALAVLKLDLQWIARQLPDDVALQEKATVMSNLIDGTIRSLREIVVRLRPDILEQLGLVAAMEHQARDFEAHTGIQCQMRMDIADVAPNAERDTTMLRVFQETLTNVARHAHATQVQVTLRVHDQSLVLEVNDNGKGMAPPEVRRPTSLGLVGMRERIAPFSGNLQILPSSCGGTLVRVSIPLSEAQAEPGAP